jgi:hypothetical protein
VETKAVNKRQKETLPKVAQERKPAIVGRKDMFKEIFSLSAGDALHRVLTADNPRQMIQSMSRVDLYWLVKKIGEDDAYPVLSMASTEQWEYLLDMEIWTRDRLDLMKISEWLARLEEADPTRLVRWLCGEGESLAFFYFFKNLHVEIKSKDDVYELGEDYTSFDGIYFFRVLDKEHEEVIKNVLKRLASMDYERYQALLLAMSGALPSELEEQMYRMRNIRLAEDGFLPYDDAIAIYSHVKIEALKSDVSSSQLERPTQEEDGVQAPLTPLIHAPENNLFVESTKQVIDPIFMDRIRLEFAGLCNQILAADGEEVKDIETLLRVCRKAAGYIHLGLEKATGGSLPAAGALLRKNALATVFRAGFSMALELKWEVERWLKKAWFRRQGFKSGFWDEQWAGMLEGVLQKRPHLFTGSQEDEPFKDFENATEVEECRITIERLMALDQLLEALTSQYPIDRQWVKDPLLTFHPLVFNLWARTQVGLEPGFGPLVLEEVRALFLRLRGEEESAPFRMPGFGTVFMGDTMAYASGFDSGAVKRLEEILSLLWDDFVDEYAWISISQLDERFLKFFLVRRAAT